MSKAVSVWTVITAILTALVYIDMFYLTGSYITIPLAVLSAIISVIISIKQKQVTFIFLNLLFAVIALIALILFP